MTRISIKITGAQGQGVNSVGEVLSKGLKRLGFCVFGYREYMSLIKGGHSSFQLDVASTLIQSSSASVDLLVAFNHHGLEKNIADVKPGGIILHQTPQWKFSAEVQADLDRRRVRVVYLPIEDILRRMKARPILGNMLVTSVSWTLLGLSADGLKELATEQFSYKGDAVVALNHRCIDEGSAFAMEHREGLSVALPKPNPSFKDALLLTGSQAMGLGLVHAGCRMYVGYPMTPSSPLLSYIAEQQNMTGMVIKQAEDEITAAQMMSGAMYMGTRAATGTSGGGFDLMTETVSLNAIIENPAVFVLAQRPGPATGLPTWTGQGDLLLAVHSAHGEFPRCVISVSDSQDAFDLLPEAFNIAEKYQIPVIVLTDKQIAEAIYTQPVYNQKRAKIRRGLLVTQSTDLKKLISADRYDPSAKNGISKRWLPGAEAATYCAQGDEHDAAGNVDESAHNAVQQMDKRMKKSVALANVLPDPELFMSGERSAVSGEPALDLLIVSWGSNKGVVLDAMRMIGGQEEKRAKGQEGKRVGYVHFSYLWPLKAERLQTLMKKAKRTVIVECNKQSQLAMLIRQESGIEIADSILTYDGRPFFLEAFIERLRPFLRSSSGTGAKSRKKSRRSR